jgi:hypothetical protein
MRQRQNDWRVGNEYAERRDDTGRHPDKRAKAGRSDQSTEDRRWNVECEVRSAEKLLHSQNVRGDGGQRRYNCAS